jgi:hypothetical protein
MLGILPLQRVEQMVPNLFRGLWPFYALKLLHCLSILYIWRPERRLTPLPYGLGFEVPYRLWVSYRTQFPTVPGTA